MAGKNIKRIKELKTRQEAEDFWNNTFVEALYEGEIAIKNGDLIVELDDNSFVIKLEYFKEIYESTTLKAESDMFKNNYNEFTEDDIVDILAWLNPVLDEINSSKLNELKNKNVEIIQRANRDSDVFNEEALTNFRTQFIKYLEYFYYEDRYKLINRILPYNILNEKDLVQLGYYAYLSESSLVEMYNEGKFSQNDLYLIGEQKNCADELIRLAESKRKVSNKKIKDIGTLIPNEKLIEMACQNEIPYSYLENSNVEKSDLFEESFGNLLYILNNKEKFPERLQITSEDLLEQYGKILSGAQLLKLLQEGYLNCEDLIEVIRKNRVLRIGGDPDTIDKMMSDDTVIEFYNQNLAIMLLKGNLNINFDIENNMPWLKNLNSPISEDFIEKYKSAIGDEEEFNQISKDILEQVKDYIMLKSEIDEKEKTMQKAMLVGYDIGLFTPDVLKNEISPEYLKEKFLEDEIDQAKLLSLFNDGIIEEKTIREYFSDDEIFNLYLSGDIPLNTISLISKEKIEEKTLEAIMDEKMPTEDLVKLYFAGIVTVQHLEDSLEFAPDDFDMSLCIDENIDFSKIKEMFENQLIDYNCVKNLKDNEMITEEQLKELEETMDREEFFDNLDGKVITLVTNREQKEVKRRKKNVDDRVVKPDNENSSNKYANERAFIAEILEVDDELKPYAIIESMNKNGRPTSLNGYNVYGSKKNGLVIFAKEQKENAVFVMPFYQAAYFLDAKGQRKGEKEVVTQDRMKDKAFLKTLNQVRVIPHTEYFARNLSLAACELSQEFKERYDTDDKYREEVQDFCEDMRLDYRIEKGLEI